MGGYQLINYLPLFKKGGGEGRRKEAEPCGHVPRIHRCPVQSAFQGHGPPLTQKRFRERSAVIVDFLLTRTHQKEEGITPATDLV